MKIAYLECQTGIAGDMCLGALVDAGVPIDYLTSHLDRLTIESEYKLWAEKIHHNGQIATKVHVDLMAIASSEHHKHHHHGEHEHDHEHDHKHEHPHHPTAVSQTIEDSAHSHSHDHPHEHHHHAPQRNLPQITV